MRAVYGLASLGLACLLLTLYLLFGRSHPEGQTIAEINAFYVPIESLLVDEKFDALESLAKSYRNIDQRLVGGVSKLYVFYHALGAVPDERCPCGSTYISAIPFAEKQRAIQKWKIAKPESIAARLAMARLYLAESWIVRGHGMANQVSQDQQKSYAAIVQQAMDELRPLEPLTDAAIFGNLLAVTRGSADGSARLRALYPIAIAAFPSYFNNDATIANLLQEKWFGVPGELAGFVNALRQKGDTGLVAYAFAADELTKQYGSAEFFERTGLDWHGLVQAYATRDRLYGTNDHELNLELVCAGRAKDRAFAGQIAARLSGDWDSGVWTDRKRFDQFVRWANGA